MTEEQEQIFTKIENINSLIFNVAEVYYHISDLKIFLEQCQELNLLSLKSGVSFKEVKNLNEAHDKGYFNYPSIVLFCQHCIRSKSHTSYGEEDKQYIKTCEDILGTIIQYSSSGEKAETLHSMRQYKNNELAKHFEALISAYLVEEEKKLIEYTTPQSSIELGSAKPLSVKI